MMIQLHDVKKAFFTSLRKRLSPTTLPVFLCLGLFQVSFVTEGQAQGLLGKPYLRGEFSMASPNDPLLKAVYDWSYTIGTTGNIPITDTFDIQMNLSRRRLDGEGITANGPTTAEIDITSFEATVIKHFFPDQPLDPFIGLGVGVANTDVALTSNTVTASDDDRTSGVFWTTGFEWKIGDQVAIRPQMGTGTSIDNFEADDFIQDLFFETEFICWLTEELFTGFIIGSDFDDTEIELGLFIGVGTW